MVDSNEHSPSFRVKKHSSSIEGFHRFYLMGTNTFFLGQFILQITPYLSGKKVLTFVVKSVILIGENIGNKKGEEVRIWDSVSEKALMWESTVN